MKTTMRILMAVAVVLVAAGAARAADSTWTNTTSSTFNDANSWNNGVPDTNNIARYNAGGASYGVNFDATKTNTQALLVLGGGTVTFNIGGTNRSYYVKGTGPGETGDGLKITNNLDTGTLVVSNGTLRTVYAYGGGFNTGAGISILVTNGGALKGLELPGLSHSSITVGGTLTVVGADSTVVEIDQGYIDNLQTRNSSTNFLRSVSIRSATIDNSVVQSWGVLVGGYGLSGTINLTNGGVYSAANTPHGAAGIYPGQDDGFAWVNIGGGSDMTRTSLMEGTYLYFNRANNASGSGHMAIYSNGLMRITGNTHAVADTAAPFDYAPTDFRIADQQAVTLLGGGIQMTNASRLTLVDFQTANAPGTLRGYGSISRIGSGSFSIDNNGYIRPGDTGTNYNHNVAGLGTISINNGSLYQTNALRDGRLYFEFSPTANDQINIANGLARITAGSNIFALATGAPSPRHGEKYGIGTFDFLVATNITYTPAYDNLVNLLTNTYHLTYGVDFQYGVVNLGGGLFALELTFVPEPSTVLLLALGGLMVWRRVAKRGKKVVGS